MLIEFLPSMLQRRLKVVVIEFGIDHLDAMVFQVRWLNAPGHAVPTVQKQDFHDSPKGQ
jgi:hypothetical protein